MNYLVGGIIVALYVGAWVLGRWIARRIRLRLDDPRPVWFERGEDPRAWPRGCDVSPEETMETLIAMHARGELRVSVYLAPGSMVEVPSMNVILVSRDLWDATMIELDRRMDPTATRGGS